MQSFHGIQPVFDEDNLVSHTGLVPVLALAERAGLSELVREHSSVPSELSNNWQRRLGTPETRLSISGLGSRR